MSTDYLSLVLTPRRIRWTIPLSMQNCEYIFWLHIEEMTLAVLVRRMSTNSQQSGVGRPPSCPGTYLKLNKSEQNRSEHVNKTGPELNSPEQNRLELI
jgi:hypothetical protein